MKQIRSISITAILILMILSININAYAYRTSGGIAPKPYISIRFNGVKVYPDTEPYIKDGRVFVPLRFAAEILGFNVDYDNEQKTINITGNGRSVSFRLGEFVVYADGGEYAIDVAPEIVNNRTMVPVRVVSEYLGIEISWDKSTLSVVLNKEGMAVPEKYTRIETYSDEDILWLSRIVYAETGWQSFDAKLGVANVVMNRVRSAAYPDTVYEVIFDTRYVTQFPPAFREGFTESIPSTDSVVAAKMALEGMNNVDNCLFFNTVPFKSKSADELYAIYDGEYFYR